MPRWTPGQRSFSTCLDLDLLPIHDVNRWYADLGVSARASRREIARAYRELDGSDSVWLTHCFTSLWDRDTRRAYDRCRSGTRYWDEYELELARSILLASAGVETFPNSSRALDNSTPEEHAESTPDWGWVCFDTNEGSAAESDRWRIEVSSAAHQAQLHRTISTGRHSHGQSWEIRTVEGITVVSLHNSIAPTRSAAQVAVQALKNPALREPLGPRHTHRRTGQHMTDAQNTTVDTDVEEFGDFSGSYGGEVAQDRRKSSGGGFGDRVPFFSMKDGEKVLVRFLSDYVPHPDNPRMIAWITADHHNQVPTKAKPDDYKGTKWPKFMGAVCRGDKAFALRYTDCPICSGAIVAEDGKPLKRAASRTWALVVLREEVREGGKIVGVRTLMRDVTDKDGNKIGQTPDIQKLNMGWDNFFAGLSGLGQRYGTLLNRDIELIRMGGGTDTKYVPAPLDVVKREDGSTFDLREESELLKFEKLLPEVEKDGEKVPGKIPDLRRQVVDQVNDHWYDLWFFGESSPSSPKAAGSSSDSAPAAQPNAPSSEPDEEKMRALRDRIKGYSHKNESPQAEVSQESPPSSADEAQQPVSAGTKSFD